MSEGVECGSINDNGDGCPWRKNQTEDVDGHEILDPVPNFSYQGHLWKQVLK